MSGGQKQETQQTTQQHQQVTPWAEGLPYIQDVLKRASGAMGATSQNVNDIFAGPNATQIGANQGVIDLAKTYLAPGAMGGQTRQGIGTLGNAISNGGNAWSTGGYQIPGLGPMAKAAVPENNFTPTGDLGGAINAVAGAKPAYSGISLKNNLVDLMGTMPDYTGSYGASVASAVNPIVQNFENTVIPALLSKQARAGGTSSRHALQMKDALNSYGTAMGQAIGGEAAKLEGLKAGSYGQLVGASTGDVTNLRDVLGADYRSLAGNATSVLNNNNNLEAQKNLQTQALGAQANQDWARATNQGSMQTQDLSARSGMQAQDINAQSYNMGQDRMMQGIQMMPGLETSLYNMGFMPYSTLADAGAGQRDWAQQLLDATQYAPWNGLDKFSSIINSTTSPYSTSDMSGTMNQTTKTTQSLGSSMLQGLMGAAGLATGIGSAGGFGGLKNLFSSAPAAGSGGYSVGTYQPTFRW